jgi:hypothetical protein
MPPASPVGDYHIRRTRNCRYEIPTAQDCLAASRALNPNAFVGGIVPSYYKGSNMTIAQHEPFLTLDSRSAHGCIGYVDYTAESEIKIVVSYNPYGTDECDLYHTNYLYRYDFGTDVIPPGTPFCICKAE